MAFVRRVRTASGATAVQIAEYVTGRQRIVAHVGSAHTEAELGVLLERARELLIDPGQGVLGFAVEAAPQVKPLAGRAEAPGLFADPRPPAGVRGGAGRVVSTDSRVLYEALAGVYAWGSTRSTTRCSPIWWLHESWNHLAAGRGPGVDRPGAAPRQLRVDEASLAATLDVDRIAACATEPGAKLLLVGDWAQLSSVDAGGAFGLLVRDRGPGAPELGAARRFTHAWERAASTRLRVGDPSSLDDYVTNRRIIEGGQADMVEGAWSGWAADERSGLRSLMIAADRATVRALNERARAECVAAGLVGVGGVALHDGLAAGVGDRIVTRRNDRRLTIGGGWVKNGDTWVVTGCPARLGRAQSRTEWLSAFDRARLIESRRCSMQREPQPRSSGRQGSSVSGSTSVAWQQTSTRGPRNWPSRQRTSGLRWWPSGCHDGRLRLRARVSGSPRRPARNTGTMTYLDTPGTGKFPADSRTDPAYVDDTDHHANPQITSTNSPAGSIQPSSH